MPQFSHKPVLLNEVLETLQPQRGGVFIDATLGLGGHTLAILECAETANKKIRLIGVDQDGQAMEKAKEILGDKIEYALDNFSDLDDVCKDLDLKEVDGILMDIGVSSYQLEDPERGFSFLQDGPLDMRMDQENNTVTAATIVNTWPEYKLANLIFQYGEERLSRKIAREIYIARKKKPFYETKKLADFIYNIYPSALKGQKIHPATRTFQALRIEVNREMDALKGGIEQGLKLLAPGGVLAVISFHSLEDRIVKHRFRDAVTEGGFELVNKKPIMASDEELADNPRSRSAKLRGIRRMR